MRGAGKLIVPEDAVIHTLPGSRTEAVERMVDIHGTLSGAARTAPDT